MDAITPKPPRKFYGFRVKKSDEPLLAGLSIDHRAVLTTEGGYEAIAAKLEIPLGTVRSRLFRARTALVALREKAPAA